MLAIAGQQQSVLDPAIQADQKLIAGKGRRRLTRRVAVSRRTQRQRLPPALPCLVEAVVPRQRSRPDIANAVGGGQGGDVQEDRWKRGIGNGESVRRRPSSFMSILALPCRPVSYSATAQKTSGMTLKG